MSGAEKYFQEKTYLLVLLIADDCIWPWLLHLRIAVIDYITAKSAVDSSLEDSGLEHQIDGNLSVR
jgi:hypothetical protein